MSREPTHFELVKLADIERERSGSREEITRLLAKYLESWAHDRPAACLKHRRRLLHALRK